MATKALNIYKKYHKKVKGYCNSRKNFLKNVRVSQKHITFEAGNKLQPARFSLLVKEVIASIIYYGKLNEILCQIKPLRIVVESYFENFMWTNLQSTGKNDKGGIIKKLPVRLVIEEDEKARKGKQKNVVITVHPMYKSEIKLSEEVEKIPKSKILEW